MTLIIPNSEREINQQSAITLRAITKRVLDYYGYIRPFLSVTSKLRNINYFSKFALLGLKTIEYSVYTYEAAPLMMPRKQQELILKITNKCNEKCKKCGIWKNIENPQTRLEPPQFISCLNQVEDKINRLSITGGEPLLYKRELIDYCIAANDLKIPVTIVTNGTLVDKQFLEVIKNTNTTLVFSFDTLDPAEWLKFRGTNSFASTYKNLLTSYDTIGSRTRIQSVICNETETSIKSIKELCDRLNIIHMTQPLQDFGGEWKPARKVINANASEGNHKQCKAWNNICIYPDGDVVRCFDHFRINAARDPLGNIKHETINEILVRKKTIEITDLMKNCSLPCKMLTCNMLSQ